MGDVLCVNFGAEKVWDSIHQRLTETMLIVGDFYGDNDKELLRAKANCAHAMIRKILEEVPSTDFGVELSDGLSPEQELLMRDSLRTAAFTGIETALRHSVAILANSIYYLCTSMLAEAAQPNTD